MEARGGSLPSRVPAPMATLIIAKTPGPTWCFSLCERGFSSGEGSIVLST